MSKKLLILMALILFLSAGEVQAATAVSWDGGGDGHSWEDANNWDPNIVPEGDFDVTIDADDGRVEVELQNNHTINTLACKGNEVELQASEFAPVTLTLTDPCYAPLTDGGELEITAYGLETFEICGNVTNSNGGLMDFWGAKIDGNLLNPAGGIIEINGEVGIEGNCENAGLVTVAMYHDFDVDQSLSNTGIIRIYGGGCSAGEVLDNNNAGEISGFGILYGREFLTNYGTIRAIGGSLAVATGGQLSNLGLIGNAVMASLNVMYVNLPTDLNNNGSIVVNAGGGVAFDCNLVNEPNGIIKLLGGTLAATTITQKADANFTGFGSITGDVIINPDGLIKLTGPTNIIGNVNIPTNATLEISDGQTLITGHTVCDGTIHLIGGTVVFQGGCDCDGCNIINEAGTDRNHFDINADGIEDFKDFASFANTWLWQATWY
jgi:hypothetical protein